MQPCVITYTGRRVNPLAVRPEDVCIEDVAHSLACTNRFCGHTRVPWTTAQHSIGASLLVRQSKRLKTLLHDGGEAYVGDMTKWLKASPEMAAYREADRRAQESVYLAFGVDPCDDEEVDEADRFMVRLEGTDGYGGAWVIDHPLYGPITDEERQRLGPWRPWDWKMAEREFLNVFRELAQW